MLRKPQDPVALFYEKVLPGLRCPLKKCYRVSDAAHLRPGMTFSEGIPDPVGLFRKKVLPGRRCPQKKCYRVGGG